MLEWCYDKNCKVAEQLVFRMNTDPNDLLTEWEGWVGNIWWKALGLTTGKQRFVHQDQEPYIFPSSLTSVN